MTEPMFALYSQEAEEAVLGSVVVNSDVFLGVSSVLTADDFYIARHQFIWNALVRLNTAKLAIDYVTLIEELRSMGRLADIGGEGYLLHLVNSTPTSSNAETYARMVQRTAVRRRLLIAADKIKALATDEQITVNKVLLDAEKAFAQVRGVALEDRRESFRDMVVRLMASIDERMANPDIPVGTPTGFRDLDDVTSGGLHKGKLYILAARPGMGKTSMLLTVALNAAKLGQRVAVASQEMSRDEVIERFAAVEAGINLQKITMGRLTDDEYRRFIRAGGILGELPIEVDDANRLTPLDLRAKCLRWQHDHGLDLLIVDYLQILSSGGAFNPNQRVQEVGYFAREMKQIAREFHVPVYCAAQLNRGVEERNDKRPQLSDLRESGEIEQEADVVEFIYRDAVYNEATEFPSRADIIIAKHRNGPTGTVSLHFEKTTTRFTDQHTTLIDLSAL